MTLRRMLASDLVRALPNRCLRDIFFVRPVAVRMVIAHLLGVTPVLAARRGPNGCRARTARCEAHDASIAETDLAANAVPRSITSAR